MKRVANKKILVLFWWNRLLWCSILNQEWKSEVHSTPPIRQCILWTAFFSPSDTGLPSHKTDEMEEKLKHQRNPHACTPLYLSSKLQLGKLVKMYQWKGMEISSAALELKPWRVGKSEEAVKHLESLRLSPLERRRKTRRHPKCCIPLHLALLHPFSCPDPSVMEDPRPSDFEMKARSSGAVLIWIHSHWSPPRSPPDLLLPLWDWSACWSFQVED